MAELRMVERDDPEDVFTLLSDDIRIGILRALWDADDPMAFSELREAAGVGDSGQFNYHLGKLVGRFVRKASDGYELTQAGKGINGEIEAGAYTHQATLDPIDLGDCPYCGGDRTLAYEDEVVNVECDACGLCFYFAVPPGAFDGYDREAIPRVASRYLRATFHQLQSGFCWFCEGRTRPTVGTIAEPAEVADGSGRSFKETRESRKSRESRESRESRASSADDSRDPSGTGPGKSGGVSPDETGDGGGDDDPGEIPVVHYDCERCGHRSTTGLRLVTLDHPAVRKLYYEHGIDVRDRPFWEFPVLDADYLNVRSRDPLRASVTYDVDGESLTLLLDGDAEVVEVEAR